ncbi:MAG: phage tail protein [Deltaproteobacteria bacterium]|nr:phage tail protein [Deltaproteobacteria bacterium]
MSEPFLGEIRTVGFNFAPRGWALCNGQILPVAQYSALFSLLGTIYGGDGVSSFALPNLQGRFPVHYGSGPGWQPVMGQAAGAREVTLTTANLPPHSHALNASTIRATSTDPANLLPAADGAYGTGAPLTTLAANAVGQTGGSNPVATLPPYLVVNFIIALEGIYPSRS